MVIPIPACLAQSYSSPLLIIGEKGCSIIRTVLQELECVVCAQFTTVMCGLEIFTMICSFSVVLYYDVLIGLAETHQK